MSKVAEASEPSMQEILASIRKIISEEDMPEAGDVQPAELEDVFADAEAAESITVEPDMDAADGADGEAAAVEDAPPPEDAPEDADVEVSNDDIDAMFEPPEDDDEDLLELTPDMEIELDAPAPVESMDDDVAFDEGQAEAEAQPPEPQPEPDPEPEPIVAEAPEPEPPLAPAPTVEATPVPRPVLPSEKILSDTTDAAVGAAFGQLNSLLLAREARTVEDLIRDMLQPMLKGWLDDNLPTLVEKIVREEIERVSRGR